MNLRRRILWFGAIAGLVTIAGVLVIVHLRGRIADRRRARAEVAVSQYKGAIEEMIEPFNSVSRPLEQWDLETLHLKSANELAQIENAIGIYALLAFPEFEPAGVSQKVLARLDAMYAKACDDLERQPDPPREEFRIAYWKHASQLIANGVDIDSVFGQVPDTDANMEAVIDSVTEKLKQAGAFPEGQKSTAALSMARQFAEKVRDNAESHDADANLARARIAMRVQEFYSNINRARMALSLKVLIRQMGRSQK